MFLRILKKDLKRKKTMNIIMVLFIVLATMFVASGINNVITVMGGTDYYLDLAGVGDFIVLTMGENSRGLLKDIVDDEPAVKEARYDEVIYGSKANLKDEDGKELEAKNTVLYQCLEESSLKFFDANNDEITEINPGHGYASGSFLEMNEFEPGDKLRIEHGDVKFEITLDGIAKDAFLGSGMMGNTRILLSKDDIDKLYADEVINQGYLGEICYMDTDDVQKIISAISDAPSIAFDGDRNMIKMCYVMDMIVAFITLILSICLIIVSFVVLKFSITFTISEEFREIGVMKAIGIGNFKIRSLYLAKYLLLSVVGAVVGFIASVPFGRMLIRSVSKNMVLVDESNIAPNIFGAVLVILVILLFAFACTGQVKKSSPIDAIRSGQTGERYNKKSALRIGKGHTKTAFFMALNDVLSAPKRFLTIIITFCLCTMLVLVLVNTTETMNSPALIGTFGSRSDIYVTDVEEVMEYMGGTKTKEDFAQHLLDMEKELADEGMPCKVDMEVQYKYKITSKGNDYTITCQQSMIKTADEYDYTEGIVPNSKNEIAITPQISEKINAKIGDTVTVDFGSEKMDCMIVAYYESMNQLGEIIRLHQDAPTEFDAISSMMSYQIDFTDSPSPEEIEVRKARISKFYDNEKVFNQAEYCVDCIGVVDTMKAVQFLLLGITLIVILLVTILMERTFIVDERSQIAILKAIGFRDSRIISWHVIRFGIVGIAAAILAAALSIPMTHLCITPIFGMMGAYKIKYVINPLLIFVVYPGIIFAMTVLVAFLTAQITRTISCSDTANIE